MRRKRFSDHGWGPGDAIEHVNTGQRRLVVRVGADGCAWIAQPSGLVRRIKNPAMWVLCSTASESSTKKARHLLERARKLNLLDKEANFSKRYGAPPPPEFVDQYGRRHREPTMREAQQMRAEKARRQRAAMLDAAEAAASRAAQQAASNFALQAKNLARSVEKVNEAMAALVRRGGKSSPLAVLDMEVERVCRLARGGA